ncbi:CBO0543 family protein [Paenibacillus turpanensis]|uniref:CBO0543 family protein n=1 Tax=Paenibacillus turpanensis TaxID=2689078 RepID=UPI00140D88C5|nr:CBO0543 family protein [Paenibacillus turpanensis]
MTKTQEEQLIQLNEKMSSVMNDWTAYWQTYSSIDTWPFWVSALIFVLPLVVFYFAIDKSKVFQVGFFGFTAHVIAVYVDLYAVFHRMWMYPYKVYSFPPASFGVDAALIPVAYALLYQWTLNHRKNYYLYSTLLAGLFSFVIKPLMSYFDLFRLLETNYFTLFLLYLFGGFGAKWLSDLFTYAHNQSVKKPANP